MILKINLVDIQRTDKHKLWREVSISIVKVWRRHFGKDNKYFFLKLLVVKALALFKTERALADNIKNTKSANVFKLKVLSGTRQLVLRIYLGEDPNL